MATLPVNALHIRPSRVGGELRARLRRERREPMASCGSQQTVQETPFASPEFGKDWALVQQAMAGDTESRERLFAPYTSRLYRTAFAVLRNKEDAEDALQDGLCKAYANLASYQGRSSLSTWLTSIVKNAALMALRRKKCRPEASLDELLEGDSDTFTYTAVDARPNPEQTCAASEIKILIDKHLRELSPALRVALRLRTTKALSTAELGQVLGISAAAFKSRISRARRQIASDLRRALIIPEIA